MEDTKQRLGDIEIVLIQDLDATGDQVIHGDVLIHHPRVMIHPIVLYTIKSIMSVNYSITALECSARRITC